MKNKIDKETLWTITGAAFGAGLAGPVGLVLGGLVGRHISKSSWIALVDDAFELTCWWAGRRRK